MDYKIVTCECGNTYSRDIWDGKCYACGRKEKHSISSDDKGVYMINDNLQKILDEQAEDAWVWFPAKHASEHYIQAALRRLHAAIESRMCETNSNAVLADVRADLQSLLFIAIDRNDGWDDEVTEKIKILINKVSEHFS